jgi:cytochrome b involved in lipid metabolism
MKFKEGDHMHHIDNLDKKVYVKSVNPPYYSLTDTLGKTETYSIDHADQVFVIDKQHHRDKRLTDILRDIQ